MFSILLQAFINNKRIELYNIAMEPVILNLINFIKNSTNREIKFNENSIIIEKCIEIKKYDIEFYITPDLTEAFSYILLANSIKKDLILKSFDIGILPESYLLLLKLFDIETEILNNGIKFISSKTLSKNNINFLEIGTYPRVSTDLAPIITLALALKKDNKVYYVLDTVHRDRQAHLVELRKLGFNILYKDGLTTIISNQNKNKLIDNFNLTDIRGGMAILIAIINYNETTTIKFFEQLQRGYSDIIYKLNKFGIKLEE